MLGNINQIERKGGRDQQKVSNMFILSSSPSLQHQLGVEAFEIPKTWYMYKIAIIDITLSSQKNHPINELIDPSLSVRVYAHTQRERERERERERYNTDFLCN